MTVFFDCYALSLVKNDGWLNESLLQENVCIIGGLNVVYQVYLLVLKGTLVKLKYKRHYNGETCQPKNGEVEASDEENLGHYLVPLYLICLWLFLCLWVLRLFLFKFNISKHVDIYKILRFNIGLDGSIFGKSFPFLQLCNLSLKGVNLLLALVVLVLAASEHGCDDRGS